jgi:hypothetical protein
MRKFKGGTRSSMSEFVLIKALPKYNSKIFLSLVSDILAVPVANFGLISSMSL